MRTTAPVPSIRKVPIRAWRTTRTTPSISLRFSVETIMSRSESPILRRRAKETRVMTVINPRPPSWIIARMTTCPNRVQCAQVSTRIRPVTQDAEVAVKRQVSGSVACPSRLATGSMSSSVPSKMITPKEETTMRAGFRFCMLRSRLRIRQRIWKGTKKPP